MGDLISAALWAVLYLVWGALEYEDSTTGLNQASILLAIPQVL